MANLFDKYPDCVREKIVYDETYRVFDIRCLAGSLDADGRTIGSVEKFYRLAGEDGAGLKGYIENDAGFGVVRIASKGYYAVFNRKVKAAINEAFVNLDE